MALLSILFSLPGLSRALVIEAQQQMQYADRLFDQKQYRQAGEEYQRFAFFFLDHPKRRQAIFSAGRAFLHAEDVGLALAQFKQLTDTFALDPLAIEAFFMTVECYLNMKSASLAIAQLHNIITLAETDSIKDRAYHRLSWIYIDQTDWKGARQALDKITASSRSRYRVDELITALAQSSSIAEKSPGLAGTLSVIPGAGQLYCQRYEDALIALIVNAGLFWAAYDAYDHDQYGLGSLLAFVGLGFYAGNIYGAVTDAHKFNRDRQLGYGDQLKQDFLIRTGHPSKASTQGLIFGFQFAF
jgi:tetratricopeptide (TPR) repeat protein